MPLEIVEWPGDEPRQIGLDVTPQMFAAVRKGRMSVPLGNQPDLAELAGLPWCSIGRLKANGDKLHRIVGPAISQTTGWALPMFPFFPDPATGMSEFEKEADKLRKAWGLDAAQV